MLALRIFSEADTNQSGKLTYREFVSWRGCDDVLDWIDRFNKRVITNISNRAITYSISPQSELPVSRVATTRYPWEGITITDLVRVFRSEAWGGTLVLSEFERVLSKLGVDGRAVGRGLFAAFDTDNSGTLDFKEMFIGLSLLLSSSREQRLECAFLMMDDNGSGRVSQREVEVFLKAIAPRSVGAAEIRALSTQIMREVDTDRSGLITYREFMMWPGKTAVLSWLDAYHERVLSRYGQSESVLVRKDWSDGLHHAPWVGIDVDKLVRAIRSRRWGS